MTVVAVSATLRTEISGENLNDAMKKVQDLSKARDEGFDVWDWRGRLLAKVHPQSIERSAWCWS